MPKIPLWPPPPPPKGPDDEEDAVRAERARRFDRLVAFEAIDAGLGLQHIGRAVQSFGAGGGMLEPARQRDFWDRTFSALDRVYEHLERLRDRTLN